MENDLILSLQGLTKTFGGLNAVKGVSFNIGRGEIVSLVGPNGSGKTTLFNCVNGIYPVNEGRIFFQGEDITRFSVPLRCRIGIGRTFQVVRPFLRLTCLENILVGWYFGQGDQKNESRGEGARVLEFVGLGEKANIKASELRLSERKRLEIARALATQPRLLLLDEVAAGLNEIEIQEMIRLLRQIHAKGISLLVVEHVMSLVMDISHRVVVLNEGQKIAEGPPEVIVNDQKVIEIYLGNKEGPFMNMNP
jgi:branched-chain amino acid transport system ATP-binding protein